MSGDKSTVLKFDTDGVPSCVMTYNEDDLLTKLTDQMSSKFQGFNLDEF